MLSGSSVVEVPRRVDVVDLSMGYQEYLAPTVRRGTRQNVAKAARNGVEIERDTTGRLIPVFYDLYLSWVERWIPRSGLPPALARHSALKQEPYAKFETVAALMGDKCRVFVAWHQGRAVASCINFVHGEHAIGWRSYSIKELAGPVAANTATQVAGDPGCDGVRLPLRRPRPERHGSNLQSYKNSLGADPWQVIDLRIEPPVLTGARTAVERGKSGVVGLLSRLGYGSLTTTGRRRERFPAGRNHGSRPTRLACHQTSARAMPCRTTETAKANGVPGSPRR